MISPRLCLTVLFLFLTLIFICVSFSYEPKARVIPLFVGLVTSILILGVLLHEILPIPFLEKLNQDLTGDYRTGSSPCQTKQKIPRRIITVILFWIFGFFVLILALGFNMSIALFSLLYFKIQGGYSWGKSLFSSAVIWAAVFVLFELILNYSLFKGVFFGEMLPPI